MDEHIQLRAGLDTTDFDRKESSMRSRILSFGEAGHKSFLHASNGAREFHKTLHSITEQSGVMGTVMKFALSPIAGILTGVTLGFEFLSKTIDELNHRWDGLERLGAKPISDIAKNMREAKNQISEFNAEFKKWMEERGIHDTRIEKLKEQLDLLEAQSKEAEKLAKAGMAGPNADALERKRLQVQFGLQGQALMAAAGEVGTADSEVQRLAAQRRALLGSTAIQKAQGNVEADREQIQEQEKLIAEANARRTDTRTIMGYQLKYGGVTKEFAEGKLNEDLDKETEGMTEMIKLAKKRIEQNLDVIDRENNARKEVANKLEEAKTRFTQAQTSFNTLSHGVEATRQLLSVMPDGTAMDVRSPQMKAVDDWQSAQSNALSDWNISQSKGARSFVDRLTPFKTEQKPVTPETQMKALEELMRSIDTKLGAGIPVFGKE